VYASTGSVRLVPGARRDWISACRSRGEPRRHAHPALGEASSLNVASKESNDGAPVATPVTPRNRGRASSKTEAQLIFNLLRPTYRSLAHLQQPT
jgi:hypothetical protein